MRLRLCVGVTDHDAINDVTHRILISRAVTVLPGSLAGPTAPYGQVCAVDCLQVQTPSNRGGATRQSGRKLTQRTAPLPLVKLSA